MISPTFRNTFIKEKKKKKEKNRTKKKTTRQADQLH